MQKVMVAAVLLAIGFVAGSQWHTFRNRNENPAVTQERVTVSIPAEYQTPTQIITTEQAKDHRERHYQTLNSVKEVFELPSGFSQTEALSAIAGRAGANELEDLILQSVKLSDRYDRRDALDLLFSRYTELDPYAALTFLQLINLNIEDRILGNIFSDWARFDLPAAMTFANQITDTVQRKKAGQAVLRAASQRSHENLPALAAQMPDHHSVEMLESSALGVRASHDPEAALHEAIGMSGSHARGRAIYEVAKAWTRSDPSAAVAAAENIANRRSRTSFLTAVYNQWVTMDPDQAIASMLAIPDLTLRDRQLQSVMYTLAANDPEKSLELAANINAHGREQAYSTVFQHWIEHDIEGAMQAVSKLTKDLNRPEQLNSMIAYKLAELDPDRALVWADSLKDQWKDQIKSTIYTRIAEADPLRAIDAALAIESPTERGKYLSSILSEFAKTDPQLALQYINEMPDGAQNEYLYRNIASQWAASDLQAAVSWAATLSGPAQVQAMSGMARHLALNDPQQAAAIVHQLPVESRGQVLQSIVSTMNSRDPEGALAWLKQFSSDPAYEAAVIQTIRSVALMNPRQALDVASGLRHEHRLQATKLALGQWAHREPAAAARWAASSDEAVRSEAIRTVVSSWGRADPLAALHWTRTLRMGDAKDNALAGLVGNSAFNANEVSRMIGNINSDQIRDQAISSVFSQLSTTRNDPQAAIEFLEQIGASEALKEQLLSDSGG